MQSQLENYITIAISSNDIRRCYELFNLCSNLRKIDDKLINQNLFNQLLTITSQYSILNDNFKHNIFLNITDEFTKFSKCISKQVGCIIVKDNRIISSGVNGSPSGATNCCEIFDKSLIQDPEYREKHHKFSESMECHAEENAIINAAKYGICLMNSELYVSMKPCERCLKMIANLGIKNIYYRNDYDKFIEYSEEVKQMITDLHINIIKINPELTAKYV